MTEKRNFEEAVYLLAGCFFETSSSYRTPLETLNTAHDVLRAAVDLAKLEMREELNQTIKQEIRQIEAVLKMVKELVESLPELED